MKKKSLLSLASLTVSSLSIALPTLVSASDTGITGTTNVGVTVSGSLTGTITSTYTSGNYVNFGSIANSDTPTNNIAAQSDGSVTAVIANTLGTVTANGGYSLYASYSGLTSKNGQKLSSMLSASGVGATTTDGNGNTSILAGDITKNLSLAGDKTNTLAVSAAGWTTGATYEGEGTNNYTFGTFKLNLTGLSTSTVADDYSGTITWTLANTPEQ
ncbi:MAG TPA: hypothetical protein VGC17_08285 [Lactovum miscens]|uniref:hypothetical protein n=1 Tax=Lactovum miscens TaxID=190387 RepID=UPI002ED8A2A0